MPRGLVVVLAGNGLMVGVVALRQFASIIGPVLLVLVPALVLGAGVHPLTGSLRRQGARMWLAATVTLITLVAVILGLAASSALSVAQLFAEQWASEIETSADGWLNRSGSPIRSDCRRPSWPRWVQHTSGRRVMLQPRIGPALALH